MQEKNTEKKNMNMVLAVVICLALVGVLIFISINNKVNMNPNNNDNLGATGANNDIPTPNPPEATDNETAPVGTVAKTGDTVAMNYTGRLENGTVFDSSVDPKFGHVKPFVFNLGAGQVIAGWDEGIVGMKIGEKKTLVIPPEKGYGPNDYGPIPGNSTLTFEVELLGIK